MPRALARAQWAQGFSSHLLPRTIHPHSPGSGAMAAIVSQPPTRRSSTTARMRGTDTSIGSAACTHSSSTRPVGGEAVSLLPTTSGV